MYTIEIPYWNLMFISFHFVNPLFPRPDYQDNQISTVKAQNNTHELRLLGFISFHSSLIRAYKIVVNAGSRAVIVDEGVCVSLLAIVAFAAFIGKIREQIMHLAEVFPLSQRCVLNDSTPAVRVGQTSVPYGFEDIISRVDCSDWTIERFVYHFARANKGWKS